MQSVPSSPSVIAVPSTKATPSCTFHVPSSCSPDIVSSAVPSAFSVIRKSSPSATGSSGVPSSSISVQYQLPTNGAPASPTGIAGAGVAVGSGVGIGVLLTAASSAETSGSCAGLVRHSACGKASVPSMLRKAYSLISCVYAPRYTASRLSQPSNT